MVTLNQNWRTWFAFGSGVGIVITAERLEVMVVRVRPDGPRFTAAAVIEGYSHRPAAEWGAEYLAFLTRHGLAHAAALALLPREDVILRTISLPAVEDEDAAAAIGFQLDSLHPYPEEEVYFDWRRVPGAGDFVVAIALKQKVDHYTVLFEEAGIRLNGFSVSAASIHRSLRLFGRPPADGFLAQVGPGEFYGESPAKRAFSAMVDPPGAVSGALAELRLAPETEPLPLADLLPPLRLVPEDFDRVSWALPYAASLASSAPHLGTPLNLLPEAKRAGQSRAHYIPTAVLAVLLAAAGLILALQRPWQDRQYLGLLKAEIARIEPVARKVEALDKQLRVTAARARLLDEFRARPKTDLDLLLELTHILKPPTYLQGMEITRTSATIVGEAEQAEGLLKVLDTSPLIGGSEFAMPISKAGNLETFRIRMSREGAR